MAGYYLLCLSFSKPEILQRREVPWTYHFGWENYLQERNISWTTSDANGLSRVSSWCGTTLLYPSLISPKAGTLLPPSSFMLMGSSFGFQGFVTFEDSGRDLVFGKNFFMCPSSTLWVLVERHMVLSWNSKGWRKWSNRGIKTFFGCKLTQRNQVLKVISIIDNLEESDPIPLVQQVQRKQMIAELLSLDAREERKKKWKQKCKKSLFHRIMAAKNRRALF